MRRRLFALALFLLLGAVINVAVAWGCFLTLPTELHLTSERWFEGKYAAALP